MCGFHFVVSLIRVLYSLPIMQETYVSWSLYVWGNDFVNNKKVTAGFLGKIYTNLRVRKSQVQGMADVCYDRESSSLEKSL